MVEEDGPGFWTVMLYTWPYLCIPVAFAVDGRLRAKWVLEDVSRPATGYRFKGANVQMVFTARAQGPERLLGQNSGATSSEGRQEHGRSRWLDCTNLWYLSVVIPAVFVCAAEWSSGAASVFLLCTPFVFLAVFSLTLSQVTVIVSLLTSPVVHVVYGVIGRGPGNGEVPSMLWSQTFIVLTAVSIAWSIRDLATLRRTAGAAVAIATANLNTIPALLDIGIDSSGRSRPSYGKGGGKLDATHARDSKAAMGLNFSPENSILQAAEALLSEDHNQNSALDGEHRVINVFSVALRQALMHGLTADTPVLQTADALHAWRKVIQYQGGVERDIRETDRWGVLAEKLISMDAGMPFMVGIVQGTLLAASQLEGSQAFGSGSVGRTFYASLGVFAVSLIASTILLIRMLGLISSATNGLAAAVSKTEAAMESFVDMRSWGVIRHGEIGCLTHIAARRGMTRVIGHLVEHGANPTAMDSTGQTPLQIADGADMGAARRFLEALVAQKGRRDGDDKASHPVREVRDPSRATSGWTSSLRRSCDEGDGGADRGAPDDEAFGRRWSRIRQVMKSVARWVNRNDHSSRTRSSKVGVEPLSTSVTYATDIAAAASSSPSVDQFQVEGLPHPVLLSSPSNIPTAAASGASVPGDVDTQDERGHENTEDVEKSDGQPTVVAAEDDGHFQAGEGMGVADGMLAYDRSDPYNLPDHGYIVGDGGDKTNAEYGALSIGQNIHHTQRDYEGVDELGGTVKGEPDATQGADISFRDNSDSQLRGKPIHTPGIQPTSDSVDGEQEIRAAVPPPPLTSASSAESGNTAVTAVAEKRAASVGEVARTPHQYTGGVSGASSLTRKTSFSVDKEAVKRNAKDVSLRAVESPGAAGAIGAPSVRGEGTSRRTTRQLPSPLHKGVSSSGGSPRRCVGIDGGAGDRKQQRLIRPRNSISNLFFANSNDVDEEATYSPTQSVLNITWALRRLRPLMTPPERRNAFKSLRESSPFHIPAVYFLWFVDLIALEEIPRRFGDRFLGPTSKRPVTCGELAASAIETGANQVVVYVSHRWLEPDFKNPDDHSKARFYQVCYLIHKLAKRMGRRCRDFYLWIDYSCMNQQNPVADRLALPYVLDACDVMVYVEDDLYWDQALSKTEHFMFHKLRRLRPPLARAGPCGDGVFSLSSDGERLTQRSYADTCSRFMHNPAKGALATETDRLYLWTLVLALEYEDTSVLATSSPTGDEETGFMRLLREAVYVNSRRNSEGNMRAESTADKKVDSRRATATLLGISTSEKGDLLARDSGIRNSGASGLERSSSGNCDGFMDRSDQAEATTTAPARARGSSVGDSSGSDGDDLEKGANPGL